MRSPGQSAGCRVLISTIALGPGGVAEMVDFVCRCLNERGFVPVIGHYEPYSKNAELSVPSYQLLQRKPGKAERRSSNGYECHALGAWLPELEFTHYLANKHWLNLIASCSYHLVASGNILPATALFQMKLPYLCWVASSWEDDRRDRVAQQFPRSRKLLDMAVNAPVIRRLEKRLLFDGTIIALSEPTRRTLNGLARRSLISAVMPTPVDTTLFCIKSKVVGGRIGFSGRVEDPRKNIELLLQAAGRLHALGHEIDLQLSGGRLSEPKLRFAHGLGIANRLHDLGYLSTQAYIQHLQTLDVFVVPSHQEGLCIAALEAMACGVPVVSTRCGGPEEFVIDGETGFLVEPTSEAMAAAIQRLMLDRELRERLGASGRRLIEQRYSFDCAASIFWEQFEKTFGTHQSHSSSSMLNSCATTCTMSSSTR